LDDDADALPFFIYYLRVNKLDVVSSGGGFVLVSQNPVAYRFHVRLYPFYFAHILFLEGLSH